MTDDLIEITVTDDEGRMREVEDEETVCLEPGEYEVEATLAGEPALKKAVIAQLVELDPDSDLTADNITIEEFEDTFDVEECPNDDNGDNIDIDDRDQTNVCNNVVNIIIRDVQNPDVDVNNEQAVSGDVSNEQAVSGSVSSDVSNEQVVEVSNEQVVDIAQELNISPVIVQQCIQQNAGRDAIIGDDDNNNGGGNNNDDDDGEDTGVKDSGTNTIDDCITVEEETATSTESASAADSATGTGTADTDSNVSATTQECIIVNTAPNKPLPFTGGSPVMYYSIVAGFVLLGASLLGTGFGVWRARQR